jgi:hemoglobin-like flavoprotein
MGSGLITGAKVSSSKSSYSDDDELHQQNARSVALVRKSPLNKHLSWISKVLGVSSVTTEEKCELRQVVCVGSWKRMCNTLHRYSDGQMLRGVDLFCKMLLSNLSINDSSEDKYIANSMKPRPGSHNYNSAAVIRRIMKYILTVRHESRVAKTNLRALGRTHARIKIGRKEFEVFAVSFIETLILFPGVDVTSEIIEAWASLLKFVIDQMCFDTIIFKDHCTLTAEDDQKIKLTVDTSDTFDMETTETIRGSSVSDKSISEANSEFFLKTTLDVYQDAVNFQCSEEVICLD